MEDIILFGIFGITFFTILLVATKMMDEEIDENTELAMAPLDLKRKKDIDIPL